MSDGDLVSPRLLNLRSTSQLLREATSSFSSNLLTFLFLSLLILSFRTVVENGTSHVTSFIDRDPSLRALLSRLDLAGNSNHPHDHPSPSRRRRPFLHLTRVGTLDDDFFSGDDDDGRSLFGSSPKPPLNATHLNFGPFRFSDPVADDGVRVAGVVRPGITFRAEGLSLSIDGENHEVEQEGGVEEEKKNETSDLGNGQEMEK